MMSEVPEPKEEIVFQKPELEELIPVRIDITLDGFHLQDTITWNLHGEHDHNSICSYLLRTGFDS